MEDNADIPPEEIEAYQAYRAKVEGTNISAQSLLATDYLNLFNEIVMLLDMLPDMPDMIEDCKMWQPKSYQEHFADSTFRDKDLAIEAYDAVPSIYKKPFEETIAQLNGVLLTGINKLDEEIAGGLEAELLGEHVRNVSRAAQALMDWANAIIHGSNRAMDQAEIDGMMSKL